MNWKDKIVFQALHKDINDFEMSSIFVLDYAKQDRDIFFKKILDFIDLYNTSNMANNRDLVICGKNLIEIFQIWYLTWFCNNNYKNPGEMFAKFLEYETYKVQISNKYDNLGEFLSKFIGDNKIISWSDLFGAIDEENLDIFKKLANLSTSIKGDKLAIKKIKNFIDSYGIKDFFYDQDIDLINNSDIKNFIVKIFVNNSKEIISSKKKNKNFIEALEIIEKQILLNSEVIKGNDIEKIFYAVCNNVIIKNKFCDLVRHGVIFNESQASTINSEMDKFRNSAANGSWKDKILLKMENIKNEQR